MLPRLATPRTATLLMVLALVVASLSLTGPVSAGAARDPGRVAHAGTDPRKTRPLYVDERMLAAQQGPAYARIGGTAQALWVMNELYPAGRVRQAVAEYTGLADHAGGTPTLAVYAIPDRDCGLYASGGLPGPEEYRAWIREVAAGLRGQKAIVVLEPDALALFGDRRCEEAGDRLALLRFASRVLTEAGAWVYLDIGHSGWTPYTDRPRLLKRAGIVHARGFSTNVSNFRRTSAERKYAAYLLRELRELGVRGKHYVVDSSRNGARPRTHEWCNPPWARLGRRPRLVFDGAFDGTLWVKHPGESDGPCRGGPGAGQWCDLLADRLLGRAESVGC